MIEVKLDAAIAEVSRAEKLLGHIPGAAHKAVSRALNRTMDGVKTEISRQVPKEYEIKISDVKKTIRIDKATPERLMVRLVSSGPVIGLQHFRFAPKAVRPRPVRGIRVRVLKSSKLETVDGAFITDSMQGIYKRKGNDRLPIERKYGPAAPSMIMSSVDRNKLDQKAGERFIKELSHEIDWVLTRGKS